MSKAKQWVPRLHTRSMPRRRAASSRLTRLSVKAFGGLLMGGPVCGRVNSKTSTSSLGPPVVYGAAITDGTCWDVRN